MSTPGENKEDFGARKDARVLKGNFEGSVLEWQRLKGSA